MKDFDDGAAGYIFKGSDKLVAIQLNCRQLNVFRDNSEVDGERVIKTNLVYSEDVQRQHGRGQRPVKPQSGLFEIRIHKDLLQVEVEDVKLVEAIRHKALQEKFIFKIQINCFVLLLFLNATRGKESSTLLFSDTPACCKYLMHYNYSHQTPGGAQGTLERCHVVSLNDIDG